MFRLIRFTFSILSVFLNALLGNWVGDQLRYLLTGERGHQLRFVYQNDKGEVIIAVNPVLTHIGPALLVGFCFRPHWLWAFITGVWSSVLISDRYEERIMKSIGLARPHDRITLV